MEPDISCGLREQLVKNDIAGALLFDPLNLMYATDSPNMQLWISHNQARWAFIAADGPIVLWEFNGCDFLSGHNPHVTEVRPNTSFTYFLAGDRSNEQAEKMENLEIQILSNLQIDNPYK